MLTHGDKAIGYRRLAALRESAKRVRSPTRLVDAENRYNFQASSARASLAGSVREAGVSSMEETTIRSNQFFPI
jgi:non-ribosomal peptide synthetase component E (peptide arylation enzyme)